MKRRIVHYLTLLGLLFHLLIPASVHAHPQQVGSGSLHALCSTMMGQSKAAKIDLGAPAQQDEHDCCAFGDCLICTHAVGAELVNSHVIVVAPILASGQWIPAFIATAAPPSSPLRANQPRAPPAIRTVLL
ncbi:DUF2946 family protein [Andreprevotia chitinilytica]|uniref:DUF2946 family protein n=1 Tax=Andreprevotia chitinilytica TaxID=396808 RepID=UPI0012EB5CDF|nr:DUF2946 family protein [Andreprevotia chitinilytica]